MAGTAFGEIYANPDISKSKDNQVSNKSFGTCLAVPPLLLLANPSRAMLPGGVCQVVEKCLPSSPAVHHKCCSLCGLLLPEGRSKRQVFTTDLAAQLDLPAAQQPEE